jgi:hypothetical protein
MLAFAMHKIFPHGLPEAVAPALWEVTGTLSFPLPRKMVIHRLADGTLLLQNVVAMDESGMRALEAIGQPSIMVVAHTMHTMDAPFYAKRFPGMKVVTTKDIAAKLEGKVKVDATPDEALPGLGIHPHKVSGMKYDEIVLDVPTGDADETRALLFTDVVGCGKPSGLMMRLLGPPGGRGVPRIVKFRQLAEKASTSRFLREIASTPRLRLVLGAHSDVVTSDAAAFLREAADGI